MNRNVKLRGSNIEKSTYLLLLGIFICKSLSADNVQGTYIDQKNKPITNAIVEWFKNGEIIAVDTTDANGLFNLYYFPTGFENPDQKKWSVSPNPFSNQLNIHFTLRSKGIFHIFDKTGKQINQLKLPHQGFYIIRWGGLSSGSGSISPGIYLLHIATEEHPFFLSEKVIYRGGGNSGLSYEYHTPPKISNDDRNFNVRYRMTSTIDSIRLSKNGTTELVIPLSISQDIMDLGNITGNVGPHVYPDSLLLETFSNKLLILDLDSLFYNDDSTSIDFTDHDKFELSEDILSYSSPVSGVDSLKINFSDVMDPSLTDSLYLSIQTLEVPDTLPPTLTFPEQSGFNEDDSLELYLNDYVDDNSTFDDNIKWTFSGGQNLKVRIHQGTMIIKSEFPDWNGQDTIRITASDQADNQISQSMEIIIYPVNDTPVFEGPGIPDIITYQDSVFSLHANFSDVDNDSLIFIIRDLPEGAIQEWDQDGHVIIDLPVDFYGSIAGLNVLATDLIDTVFSNSFSLSVIKNNLPPVISPELEDVSFNEDEVYSGSSLTNFASDDLDSSSELSWTVVEGKNIYVTIDLETQVPYYSSKTDFNGSEKVIFTVTDKDGLYDKDTINVSVLPVNDPPFLANHIEHKFTDPNEGINIHITHYFEDVDDSVTTDIMTLEILNLQHASWFILNDTTIQIQPELDYIGDISGLVIKMTDPDGLSAESNMFEITVNPFPCETWFILKDAAMDTLLNDNMGQIKFKLYLEDTTDFQWDQDSIRIVSNGIVKLNLYQGRSYEIDGIHPESVDDYMGVSYTFFRRKVDIQAFEQRSKNDQLSMITVPSKNTDSIFVYKVIDDSNAGEIIHWMRKFASENESGENIGIRKFSTNDTSAILWWDNNFSSLPDQYRNYLNEFKNDLNSLPFAYLTLPLEESTSQPPDPHVRIAMDNSFTEPALHETFYNQYHEITLAQSLFQQGPSEYTFKKEIYESMTDLNDLSSTSTDGSPPSDPYFTLFTSQDISPVRLNNLGRKIFSILFLAQPKSQF